MIVGEPVTVTGDTWTTVATDHGVLTGTATLLPLALVAAFVILGRWVLPLVEFLQMRRDMRRARMVADRLDALRHLSNLPK